HPRHRHPRAPPGGRPLRRLLPRAHRGAAGLDRARPPAVVDRDLGDGRGRKPRRAGHLGGLPHDGPAHRPPPVDGRTRREPRLRPGPVPRRRIPRPQLRGERTPRHARPPPHPDIIHGVALQPDGKILAAGVTFDDTVSLRPHGDFLLVRYTPAGELDPTF